MGICDAVAVSQIWKSSDHEKCLYVQINVGFCRATKLSIMSFVLFDKDDNVVFVFKKWIFMFRILLIYGSIKNIVVSLFMLRWNYVHVLVFKISKKLFIRCCTALIYYVNLKKMYYLLNTKRKKTFIVDQNLFQN